MKILLIGEYSRLHNSLKEGLATLGHEAVIVGTGDDFKDFNIDFSIAPAFFGRSQIIRKTGNAIKKLTGLDLERTEKGLRFYFLLPKLKGYDHVQLINSDAIETHPAFAKWLLKKLLKQNKGMSLLVCGDETPVIDYCLSGQFLYSVLTPYLKDTNLKKHYSYSLKYTHKNHRMLFNWLAANTKSIITSDLDYHIPMIAQGYNAQLIPNPANVSKIAFTPLQVTDKVIIFLGINRLSYIKKGIIFFEEALKQIQKKYSGKAEIIVTENIPYAQYIELYNRAHIVLDQVYAYDQGYNALEAMAKGKVVFTGAEAEFTSHYKLTEKVAINALPDVNAIVNDLSFLIENPAEIVAIGKRARNFIEKEHDFINVAKQYLNAWKSN